MTRVTIDIRQYVGVDQTYRHVERHVTRERAHLLRVEHPAEQGYIIKVTAFAGLLQSRRGDCSSRPHRSPPGGLRGRAPGRRADRSPLRATADQPNRTRRGRDADAFNCVMSVVEDRHSTAAQRKRELP